jgi:GDP-4-dehydro-6-deoxy-D-mannose reductase
MTILITGASGFIGQRLLGHLKAAGTTAAGMGRGIPRITSSAWITVPDYTLTSLLAATQGMTFDAVVHLAAAGVHPADRDPTTLVEGNTIAPAAIVQLAHARSARAVIVGGSSAEYAPSNERVLGENALLESTALYGATKAAGGLVSLAVAASLGLPCAVLRFFNVFGAGEAPHRLLPSLFRSLREDNPVDLSPGTQVRDFIHVDDVCHAVTEVLGALVSGRLIPGAYNVATATGHSVRDFAEAVADAMGRDRALLRFGALPMRPDDRPSIIGDVSRLRSATGWAPSSSFHDAVVRSVNALDLLDAAKGHA